MYILCAYSSDMYNLFISFRDGLLSLPHSYIIAPVKQHWESYIFTIKRKKTQKYGYILWDVVYVPLRTLLVNRKLPNIFLIYTTSTRPLDRFFWEEKVPDTVQYGFIGVIVLQRTQQGRPAVWPWGQCMGRHLFVSSNPKQISNSHDSQILISIATSISCDRKAEQIAHCQLLQCAEDSTYDMDKAWMSTEHVWTAPIAQVRSRSGVGHT